MATGVKKAIEPIRAPTGVRRGGSRPKPPTAGARSASLEAPRPTPDHETAKQRLTGDTVAGPPPRAVALGTIHFGYGMSGGRPWIIKVSVGPRSSHSEWTDC